MNEKRLLSPCGMKVPNLKIIRFSKVFRFRLSFSVFIIKHTVFIIKT